MTLEPRPEEASTPAEFVAALNRLRLWSGLTYRQLEGKAAAAGDVLPPSTTATALGRTTLPREQLVETFVKACGADPENWVAARKRLAMGPDAAAPEPPSRERRRLWPLLLAAVVLVAAGAVTTVLLLGERGPLETGFYHLKPAHIPDRNLCFGEGRERNGRTDRPLAVQRPCADVVPATKLVAVGTGVYEVQWHHPQIGIGCLSVDDAALGDGALLSPHDCTGAAHQRFLLDPVDIPVPGGFLLRPVHSGLCVGVLGGFAEVSPGAEAVQTPCTGKADQEVLVEPA
ncbi:XRE family transcriptional regulator [Amycolatopsis xylanica]|uniref:XRE family transcriptional regulator n=1 Tax=Amycolatopsis xylanica TaxID=589385 RepID=UPI0011600226|nr:XRE family transcriptional regulator [Amycolatopsis xylanica]